MKQLCRTAAAGVVLAGIALPAGAEKTELGRWLRQVTKDTPVPLTTIGAEQIGGLSLRSLESLTGLTGYNQNPSALVPRRRGIDVRLSYQDLGTPGDINAYNLLARRTMDRSALTEAVFGVSRVTTSYNTLPLDLIERTDILVGGKLNVLRPAMDALGLQVAVGGGYNGALLDSLYGFGVATMPFRSPLAQGTVADASLGLRYDRFKDPLGISTDRLSVYGGFRLPVNAENTIHIVGDYGTAIKDSSFFGAARNPYAFGLSYTPPGEFHARIGYQRHGLFGDSGLFGSVGGSFDFGDYDEWDEEYDDYDDPPTVSLSALRGYALNPSAALPRPNAFSVQTSYYSFGTQDDFGYTGLTVAGRVGQTPLELSLGLSRLFTSANNPPVSTTEVTGYTAGFKYRFLEPKEPNGLGIAAGVGYNRALMRNLRGFVVGTQGYPSPVVGAPSADFSLGLRYDCFTDPLGVDTSRLSLFGGTRIPVSQDGAWSFLGELQTQNKGDNFFGDGTMPYFLGAEFAPRGAGWYARAGIQRHGLFDDTGRTFSIGGIFRF
jgi:hypothetical protein